MKQPYAKPVLIRRGLLIPVTAAPAPVSATD
jgi:hypothetical protein